MGVAAVLFGATGRVIVRDVEVRNAGMNEPTPSTREIRIAPAFHLEFVHLAQTIASRHLQIAQLHQLRGRRTVESLGVPGVKVTSDIGAGTIRIGNAEGVETRA